MIIDDNYRQYLFKQDPQHYEEYINQHPQLSGAPGLDRYAWKLQLKAIGKIGGYKDPAGKLLVPIQDFLENAKERQAGPAIILHGPYGAGKTTIARAMGRWLCLNRGYIPVEYVYWPEYIDSLFNREPMEIIWDAGVLIMDDLDSVPGITAAHNSIFVITKLLAALKRRLDEQKKLTIFCMNHHPDDLEEMWGTNPSGEVSSQGKHAASAILNVIRGHSRAYVPFFGGEMRQIMTHEKTVVDDLLVGQDIEKLGFQGKF